MSLLKNEKELEKEFQEDCNIYTQIDDIQIEDQRIIEYVEQLKGCTKDLKFRAHTQNILSNL